MVTDRLGETTTRVFDSAGRLSTLTDAESKTTTYTYDAMGRKLTTTYPDSSVMLRAELWSHFWPNCDCRDLGLSRGVLAELLGIPESVPAL